MNREGVNELIVSGDSYDINQRNMAQAAGVFSELGSRIGGLISHADVGHNIGNVIDNALPYAEKFIGGMAAGQFGGGMSAGQFGGGIKRSRLM